MNKKLAVDEFFVDSTLDYGGVFTVIDPYKTN